jgi:hypothetical protein
MAVIGQITTNLSSPVLQVAIVAVACLVLYAAVKIGYVMLKIALGLAGLALLGGSIWWFFSGMHH